MSGKKIQRRILDELTNERQKDGLEFGDDPSRYNSVVTRRQLEAVAPLTTDGDMLLRAAGANTRLPIGLNGQALVVSPAGVPVWSSRSVIQAKSAAITVDTSTTAVIWEDLLTIPITTGANFLYIHFSCGAENDATSTKDALLYFRLIVDGAAKHGVGARGKLTRPLSGAINWQGVVTAAAHTVKIQWLQDEAGTSYINPVTDPDWQYAQLMVYEVTV